MRMSVEMGISYKTFHLDLDFDEFALFLRRAGKDGLGVEHWRWTGDDGIGD